MRRALVLGATLAITSALVTARPAKAQEVGVDLGLYSAYVWRGLSLTNKPVVEPDLYVTFPAGPASITVAGWANFDLGKYRNLNDDISESGGLSAFNLSEFDPYAEIAYPAGKATLTAGVIGYIYPNKVESTTFEPTPGLLTKESNTVEIYGKVEVDVPLSPTLSIYYDVDKIKGAYFEGSVSHSIAASEKVSVDLGALAGFNAGQHADLDANGDPQAEAFNFQDNGFTHLDLSAGVPLTAGAFSITPAVHLVINGDEYTKFTSPTNTSDAKVWGGVTIGWSRSYGPEEDEAAESAE